MNFKICEDVSSLGINVAFLQVYNINKNNNDVLIHNNFNSFYSDFLNNYNSDDLETDVKIIGYRNLHESIGVTDKSLVASPESLIKILFKHHSLKPINYIVDAYNYIAIKNRISIGAHDINRICGNVRLCFTNGNETFIPLGKNKSFDINNKEYCYIDDSNEIICRLDCRQCDKTKITTETKDCLFIIQGNKDISIKAIQEAADELINLLNTNTNEIFEMMII